MKTYALVDNSDTVIRTIEWHEDGEPETPLDPSVSWLELTEVWPTLSADQKRGSIIYQIDRTAGTVTKTHQAVSKSSDETTAEIASKIDQLWQAANDYTANYISGVAIGLLTIGVIQGKAKALAVTGWSSQVWDEYYTRKAAINLGSPLNLDFSSFGPMPHSVPELRAELGM